MLNHQDGQSQYTKDNNCRWEYLKMTALLSIKLPRAVPHSYLRARGGAKGLRAIITVLKHMYLLAHFSPTHLALTKWSGLHEKNIRLGSTNWYHFSWYHSSTAVQLSEAPNDTMKLCKESKLPSYLLFMFRPLLSKFGGWTVPELLKKDQVLLESILGTCIQHE